MKSIITKHNALLISILVLFVPFLISACAPTVVKHTTDYTPSGEVSHKSKQVDNTVIYELHRVYDNTVITGDGLIENNIEGLARQGALTLALTDLASKVQSELKGNTVVMNNSDIRSYAEQNVHALVRNYNIDYQGYDQNSIKYRVKVSLRGEQIVKEIEKRVVQ